MHRKTNWIHVHLSDLLYYFPLDFCLVSSDSSAISHQRMKMLAHTRTQWKPHLLSFSFCFWFRQWLWMHPIKYTSVLCFGVHSSLLRIICKTGPARMVSDECEKYSPCIREEKNIENKIERWEQRGDSRKHFIPTTLGHWECIYTIQ